MSAVKILDITNPIQIPFIDDQLEGLEVFFKGANKDGVLHFERIHQGNIQTILLLNVIREKEKEFLSSCRDSFRGVMEVVSLQVRGNYTFDLLTLDYSKGLDLFQGKELVELLINHSRKMAAGEHRLIKYCSMYGVLTKKSETSWGKVQYVDHIKVFDKEEEKLDLYVKKMLKLCSNLNNLIKIVLCDISCDSLFDITNIDQGKRLNSVIIKNKTPNLQKISLLRNDQWTHIWEEPDDQS